MTFFEAWSGKCISCIALTNTTPVHQCICKLGPSVNYSKRPSFRMPFAVYSRLEFFQQQENETRISKKQKAISDPSVMKSDLEYGEKLDH